ncbi:MAG: Daunorubicin/doxorubicin resistance ATP-binding protein DrrA [Anaerolineae bacterium]|nr:Daunorubicin/doxorubicin resistance ATP-binding protein DrrA [Anaerolineae bacterium]
MIPIVQVELLTKRYQNSASNAVDGISFAVEAGQLFTLLGPNGAGKTTTISILTTTLSPTSGTARIAGFDVVTQASQVRQQVGIIFQKPSLDQNLSAEENVRLHAILYGLYPFRPAFSLMPREYKNKIDELSAILGIRDDIFKPIKTFSGGMKRKLEIIRSLIHRPKVLFLDEPTVGLDPASRRNLWEYIRRVRAENGTTVFLTTHYLDETEDSDTICIINKGKVITFGTPDEVKSTLIERYLIIDAADRAALRAELAGLGATFVETPQFKVGIKNDREAHRLLQAIHTPLTTLKTHNPTVEDAYLAIVEEQQ